MKTLLALSLLTAGVAASSAQSFYEVTLTPDADGGGARTGTGSGTFTLGVDNSFQYSISYSGLSGNSTAAHIHGPAPVGQPASVVYGLSGSPFGTPSGTLSGTILNLTPTDISQLNNGLWYVNVHSTTFGGGEIRGQVTAVPEPGTMALIGLAGGLMMAARRKRS